VASRSGHRLGEICSLVPFISGFGHLQKRVRWPEKLVTKKMNLTATHAKLRMGYPKG
jgi:hypothetical protein